MLADERWIGNHGIGRFARELLSRISHRRLDIRGRPMSPFDPVRLSAALARESSGTTFFSPGFNAPLYARCHTVVTVHDLNHIDIAANASAFKSLYYEMILRSACGRAAFIFTVSEFSRARIVEWLDMDPAKVINVGNGVTNEFRPQSLGSRPKGRPYFLGVGNRRPHKNEERLLRAFAASRASAEANLLLTGPPSSSLEALAIQLGISSRLRILGVVSDDELPHLYRHAVALLFPSLYEGFGLPVIEAMASGTPVLTSTTTALVEVAGEAAVLVDPTSIHAIGDGIDRLWNDAALRRELSARGLERATLYNWDEVARRAQQAFDSIAGVASAGNVERGSTS